MAPRRVLEEPRRASRGPGRIVAYVAVLTGVVLIAWFAWQFYGTTWVSHQRQEQTVEELREKWSLDRVDSTPIRTAGGAALSIVRIPRFGDDYEVPVIEGTSEAAFDNGFGHFADSAPAGGRGNYAIGAHRVTHGEPLRDMPELRAGDKVIVETADYLFTYRIVTNSLTVPFDDGWMLTADPVDPLERGMVPGARSTITLVTCASLFHTDDRDVAFGRLSGTKARAQ